MKYVGLQNLILLEGKVVSMYLKGHIGNLIKLVLLGEGEILPQTFSTQIKRGANLDCVYGHRRQYSIGLGRLVAAINCRRLSVFLRQGRIKMSDKNSSWPYGLDSSYQIIPLLVFSKFY